MRYLLLLLLGFFIFLGSVTLPSNGSTCAQETAYFIQQSSSHQIQCNKSITKTISSLFDRLLDESVYMDIQPFTRQLYGASNRTSRTTTPHYTSCFKLQMRLMIVRMGLLNQSTLQVSSVPCLNWRVSSDHYIFGMRRILI